MFGTARSQVAFTDAQFKAEKRRALIQAYFALRDQIVAEHAKVMHVWPIPTSWTASFGSTRVNAHMSVNELVRALDAEFYKQIAQIEAR